MFVKMYDYVADLGISLKIPFFTRGDLSKIEFQTIFFKICLG
jgi:hypothetical protein